MKFRTQYERKRIFSEVGSPIKVTYTPKYDEDGVLVLEATGEENLRDYINSFKDSTDINVIVKRYCNGEVDVLSQRQGVFADFTDMPKTYAEMLNRIIEGEHIFNQLPLDVRDKFNNSFSEFISQFGTEDWKEKMTVKVSESKVESEVNTDES